MNLSLGSPWPERVRQRRKLFDEYLQGKVPLPPPEPDPLAPFRHPDYKRHARKLISIRLEDWMIDIARGVAAQHDLDYQQVLRIWIEEGVRRSVEEGKRREK